MISILLLDHPGSGAPDHKTLAQYAAAMDKGFKGEYGDAYNRAATIRFGDAKDQQPSDRILGLFKDADQPGALGYHTPDGIGKVFPLLDAQDGAELSATIDHEGKELTEDLECDVGRMASDGHWWANESCDPCEQDKYQIDGVWLSDFVWPSWYSGRGTKYDQMGLLTAPLTVDAGGYAQFFDPDAGWQQLTDAKVRPRDYRRLMDGLLVSRGSRRARLALARGSRP